MYVLCIYKRANHAHVSSLETGLYTLGTAKSMRRHDITNNNHNKNIPTTTTTDYNKFYHKTYE